VPHSMGANANGPDELPAVRALRTLSIFGADQSGAYREHFAQVASALGEDIPTKLASYAGAWGVRGEPGLLILTGNAGTGKTAAAETWCRAVGAELPELDEVTTLRGGRLLIKDLSGLEDATSRTDALRQALDAAQFGQVLVCANEGILRDAAESLDDEGEALRTLLDDALRSGAAAADFITIANVNRQRPTAEEIWGRLVDFVAREELWEPGCTGCPGDGAGATGCPFRKNAAALRGSAPRQALRQLVRLGAGEAVPTMREILAILAWAIVGGSSCDTVKRDARLRGTSAHTAEDGYFHRAVGGGLRAETIERSPLLLGMVAAGLGVTADLQVDEWLRDSTGAPEAVQGLAGAPESGEERGRLAGSTSPHDRVATGLGAMTFHALGETLSTSEDPTEVEECLRALVGGEGRTSRLALWRRRIYFEAPDALGGPDAANRRLLDARYLSDFTHLAARVASGGDWVLELSTLVSGLNFLVCGFSTAAEGLIVPDQACLFARDPGSFRPARPSLVYATVAIDRLTLRCPDEGLVEQLLDIDHLEIDLLALNDPTLALRVRPRLYEAIREAHAFQGPVGQGTAEMTDVRGFYGRLADHLPPPETLRVADPRASPPSLQSLTLPHFR
jgi:hypothetical protein